MHKGGSFLKNLMKIEASLEKLQNDFNSQLSVLQSDTKEFHNSIIDLSAKYPEHKELLQFIVFINDKLETNQKLFEEIITDSFNCLIENKRSLIAEVILNKEENCLKVGDCKKDRGFFGKVKDYTIGLKDAKLLTTSLAVIAVVAGALIAPDILMNVIGAIAGLLK